MENCKKTVMLTFILGVCLCFFFAKAEPIIYTNALYERVSQDARNAQCVKTWGRGKAAIARLCRERVDALQKIVDRIDAGSFLGDISDSVAQYSKIGHLKASDYEISSLRGSRHTEEFKRNIEVIMSVYKRLYQESQGVPFSESTEDSASKDARKPKHCLHTREGRRYFKSGTRK